MENLQEFVYINELLNVYGKTLTPKQQEIMENYYVYNLTIQEIADNLFISKAAVSDAIKVSLKHLENLEANVGHLKYKKRVETLLQKIKEKSSEAEVVTLIETEEKDGI